MRHRMAALALSTLFACAGAPSRGSPRPESARPESPSPESPRPESAVAESAVAEAPGELVRGVEVLAADTFAEPGCERATHPAAWRRLRERLGGAVGALPADYASFAAEQVVVVARPAGDRLLRVAVAREEGVDVVTLELVSGEVAPGWTVDAYVLRLARRPRQLAVVVRDRSRDVEETVGVFDGR